MKFLSAFVVLVLVVGAYSNCGCLKCSKDLNVYSPRGSGLKIIYKNTPCSCLTGIPYSLQVPVQRPRSCGGGGRCYGYRVQEGNVPDPVPCPLQQEYNVQLQVPQSRPAPSYLVGLVAKTDRVLISGPPEPLPAPGCPRAIIEPIQVVQGSGGGRSVGSDGSYGSYGSDGSDGSDGSYGSDWYYGNSGQSSCGCSRYDRKVPQITPNTPLFNLQLLQRHSYTPPKSKLKSYLNSDTNYNTVQFLNSPEENFYRIAISDLPQKRFASPETVENENPNNSALNCRGRFQIVRMNPGIVRIYRRVFCQPSRKFYGNGRNHNSALNQPDFSPRSPDTYQQVFLKSQPKLFRINSNFGKKPPKVQNFDLPSQKLLYKQIFVDQNARNKVENLNADWQGSKRVQNSERISSNSGQKFLGYGPNSINIRKQSKATDFHKDPRTAQNFPGKIPKRVQPETILLRNTFSEHFKVQKSESRSQNSGNIILGSQNEETGFNTVNQPQNSLEIPQNFQENPMNGHNYETLSIISRYNGEKLNPKANSENKREENENPKANNTQFEKFQASFNMKLLYKRPSQNSAQNLDPKESQVEPNSNLNFQNFQENFNDTKDLPKNYHIIKSHQLVLAEGNSGPNTVFLSTTHQIGAISDSLLAETLDSILSKKENRPKRSINWKMLALKPENPPRYLRTHGSDSRYFVNHRNQEETSRSAPRTSLIEKLRGIHSHGANHGRTPFHHAVKHVHGINPSVYGGRHSHYGLNPSVHSGRHSVHVRKPFGDTKRSSRFPRENKRKKKVQLKKKKNNVMLKSSWKRANKIIKDWFSKGSPLSPPEIQLPTYEPSNIKRPSMVKQLSRHKRRVKDDGLLPFFTFLDDNEKINRKTVRDQKHVQKVHDSKPTEAFLEPLNFENIFHPTPILHLLNTPIRCLNHFHKLKSHVSPVVGTIPKVIQVSRRYVIGLLRNLGRNAIHLGSNFVKGFTKLKKSKLLPKKRLRRSPEPSEDDLDETSSHLFPSEPLSETDREGEEWEIGEGDGEELPSRDEAWKDNQRHPHENNEEMNSGRNRYSNQGSETEMWGVGEDGKNFPSRDEAWKNNKRQHYEDNEEKSGTRNQHFNEGSAREAWKNNRRQPHENKEKINSGRNQYSYQGTEREGWGAEENVDEKIEPKHEHWENQYNEDEIVDKVLSKLLAQKEFQDLVAKFGDQKLPNSPEDKPIDGEEYTDTESFLNGKRRKRDTEEANDKQTQGKTHNVDNIFMGLLKLLMGLGTIQENKELDNPKRQNETNSSDQSSYKEELVENSHRYAEISKGDDYGKVADFPLKPRVILLDSDSNIESSEPTEDTSTTTAVKEDRRKSEIGETAIEEVMRKIENSGNEPKGSTDIWNNISGEKKAFPGVGEARDLHLNNARPKTDVGIISEVQSIRRTREANNGPVLASSNSEKPIEKVVKNEEKPDIQTKILKATKEANEILSQPISKPSHLSELDVQVQTIKDKLGQILANIQTLVNFDFSKQLDVYQGLLKLQAIKSDIVQKWGGLIIDNKPEDDSKKNQLLVELKEAQDLKGLIFQEVAQRMNNQDSLFRGNWIEILVRLQKLHCVVKTLSQRLDDHDFNIGFLESLDLVGGNNQKAILASLKRDQHDKLEAQIDLAEYLKMILNKSDGEKIKEAAKIIWEINNAEKLQKVSILELNQKISQGLKIRKELKILFDLQKQVEKCEQKQKVLMADLGEDSAREEENEGPRTKSG